MEEKEKNELKELAKRIFESSPKLTGVVIAALLTDDEVENEKLKRAYLDKPSSDI